MSAFLHHLVPHPAGLLQHHAPFNAIECAKAAAVELPASSLIFQPGMIKKVKEGRVSITFDQKTNKLSMQFNRGPALGGAALPTAGATAGATARGAAMEALLEAAHAATRSAPLRGPRSKSSTSSQ